MIRITTKEFDREAVKQSFLREFTEMILRGMATSPKGEVMEQAIPVLAGELEIVETETGFTVGNEDPDYDFNVQDCAFSIAWNVFQKNNYTNEFGADERSCITYVAQRLLEEFPGIEFEAQHFLDTEWSNTVEIVHTVDGQIVTEIEEC